MRNKKQVKWVAVSGGFDPVHIGHVRMFQRAHKYGDKVVVIMNNDNWLRAKKGAVFMPQKERAEILRALACVDKVIISTHIPDDPDRSVCKELELLRPHVFANGGDRRSTKDIPEAKVCKKLGIQMMFNVGGGKIQSSSWLIDNAKKQKGS